MTSVDSPGCVGDVVGSRLSLTMGRLPNSSLFTRASRSWFLVQYPALWLWSRYHLSFMNSTGICCAVLGSLTMYPLSWSSRDVTQHPVPSTSAKRSFWVLLCISTHSPVLGISMRRAASVVKLDLCHSSIGPWVQSSVSQGLLQRSQGDQLLINIQALNVDCSLSFKGHKVMKDDKRGLIRCDNGT